MKNIFNHIKKGPVTYAMKRMFNINLEYKLVKKVKNIVFVGNLRFKNDLIQFCEYLNKNFPDIKVNLFTPFFVYKSNVINYGYMREDKMKLMISKFDYGLIILGKNNKDESLYKFSFLVKFSLFRN